MTIYKHAPNLNSENKNELIKVVNNAKKFIEKNLNNINDIKTFYINYISEIRQNGIPIEILVAFNQLLLEKIPDLFSKLKYIPQYFFFDSSAEIIDIPADVYIISAYAFACCDALKEINFMGTKQQWDELVNNSKAAAWTYIIDTDIRKKVKINCKDEKNIYKI